MTKKSVRILHFADAHIDMVNSGRHDPKTGLPIRIMDFLGALDQIVDRALSEKVDLVIFAGDAYRNQRPHPKFQREWQQRIVRLSKAGIPTVLLVGNHDTSPSAQGAHALHEFRTLNVANVFVADTPTLLTPDALNVPVQVIPIPWISRSRLLANDADLAGDDDALVQEMENVVAKLIERRIEAADPDIPLILAAHASVSGAKWGSERQVMLGRDLVLGGGIVNNPKLDYVALGHIHKHQDVNNGAQPPIVYAGSIERVDFGEVKEQKGFVLATVSKGHTDWEFVPLKTRRFIDTKVELDSADTFMSDIMARLPDPAKLEDAICRLQLFYPRQYEDLLDEAEIGRHYSDALSLNIAKHRSAESRSRLGDTVKVEELSPEDLLNTYWNAHGFTPEEAGEMQKLTKEVLGDAFNML